MSDVLGSAAGLPEVVFADGQALFTEGERHPEIVILVEGSVRITKDGVQIGTVDQPGAVMGEVGFLLDSPATATATAVGECRCLRADDPESFLRERPEFTLAIARVLARRLDLVTGYLADLQNQYADRSDSLGVVAQVLSALSTHSGEDMEPGSEREPEAPY
ncbi:MAG TPA: cyclic nucleotide-binding domain-containing protein [Nocardioidaceae bacterium]|nr:cyclic nucleotide-binding domain-containing protein [Nocardioidaceae bacterium]